MNYKSLRWWIYSASLLLAITASIWVTVRGPTTVAAVAQIAPRFVPEKLHRINVTRSVLDIPIREFPERAITDQYRDPFDTATVSVAPAVPATGPARVLPPPPPTVPPLPFAYRGILTDGDGSWLVQLARGNDFLLVGRGDVIDSTYRLEDLKSDELLFIYLPMSTAQTLSISPAPP